MKLHLYEFSANNDKQWVFSTLEPHEVRRFVDHWDHGSTDNDVFYNTFENGDVKTLTDLSEIFDDVLDVLPFLTDEQVFCRELCSSFSEEKKNWLDIDDLNIYDYFVYFYNRDFPDKISDSFLNSLIKEKNEVLQASQNPTDSIRYMTKKAAKLEGLIARLFFERGEVEKGFVNLVSQISCLVKAGELTEATQIYHQASLPPKLKASLEKEFCYDLTMVDFSGEEQ